jgi:tetratricopeptide (TPR) repeat protein
MQDSGGEREIRVFISSPSDVGVERARAAAVLRELSAEFAGRFRLAPVLWEESYYSAHQTFQQAIPKPSSCDLVVCILWKRLGTELPPDFNRPDGTTRTGTEYEFEEALEAALAQDAPDILVYRKRVLIDADRVGQEAAETRALNAFWQKWFSDEHGNFTASFDRFETADEFHEKLKRSVRQWLGRLGDAVTWPVAELGSPFRSLEPFGASHARVFFGRRRAIRQAVSKLAAAAAKGCPFLIVLGGSGTGKSSLVRAGVIPFLTAERGFGAGEWLAATIRPALLGDDPTGGLAEALMAVLPELAADDPGLPMRSRPAAAAEAVAAALGARPGGARLVLLVDQLEEVLLRPAEARESLIAVLDALARAGVWVVATLRNDRYAEFQASPGLVRLKADGDSFDLLPPGPPEIREIIEGPARAAGLRFEETPERSLMELLEAAARDRGALPLLQFTLQSLFIERDPASGTLLLAVYDRLGGLAGAIAGEAERLVAGLPDPLRAALPGLLLNLVEIEEGKDGAAARTLDRAALADAARRELAARMVEFRLLTIDGGGAGARLRLAHEALLTGWPMLADLIREHRQFLAVRRRLEADAAAWVAQERPADLLLPSGRRLAEAAEALAGNRADLDPDSIALVEASAEAERRRLDEQAEAQRRELELRAEAAEAREQAARRLYRRTRLAVAVVSVLLLAMIGVAALWLKQREVATARAVEAEHSYTTALKAASQTLNVVDRAAGAGRVTLPVKQALIAITGEAFGTLPSENEIPEATEARARLLIAEETANAAAAVDLGRKAIELSQGLVRRDPANLGYQEVLQEAHWQLGSSLIIAGDLAGASEHFAAAEAITAPLAEAHPEDSLWKIRLATNRRFVAEIMVRRGDLSGALDRFRQCDDAVGEGDVLLAEGDLAGATAAYRKALDATLDRINKLGTNSNLEAAAAVGHLKVGDALRVQGDVAAAEGEYDASVKAARGLFQNMQGNFTTARILYEAERGAADMALAKGDAAGALAQYQAIAGEVAKSVATAPKTPEWQAEADEIQERIGDVRMAGKDYAAAESQYRAELAATATVTGMVPEDAQWRRDVELAHGRLAAALAAKGDPAGAAAEYRIQNDLAAKLTALAPDNADWRRDLALGLAGLGAVSTDRQEAADALARCAAAAVGTPSDPRDELAHDPRDQCRAGAGK